MKKNSKILSLTHHNAMREIAREGVGKIMEENIRDISISANGTIWAIGLDPNASEQDAGGGPVKYKESGGKKWKSIESGGATKIDGGPKGSKAYIVNNKAEVWQLEVGKKPIQLAAEGFAREISAGADGTIWVVSQEGIHGGGEVYYWEDEHWIKAPLEIGAIKITGKPDGTALIVDSHGIMGSVSKEGNYEQLTGEDFAKEVSVAPDGSIWIISHEHHQDGGNKVSFQESTGKAWEDVEGGATILDAGFA